MLFGIGLLVGATAIYVTSYFEKKKLIENYKEGFMNGYETQNGLKPFTEQKQELQVVQNDIYNDYEHEEEVSTKPERWD